MEKRNEKKTFCYEYCMVDVLCMCAEIVRAAKRKKPLGIPNLPPGRLHALTIFSFSFCLFSFLFFFKGDDITAPLGPRAELDHGCFRPTRRQPETILALAHLCIIIHPVG